MRRSGRAYYSRMTHCTPTAFTLSVVVVVFAADRALAQSIRSEADAAAMCAAVGGYVPGPDATPSEADRAAFANESFCEGYISSP